ncbi:MAG: phosphatidylglycerophosphatase A [Desulfovibrionaceae bacterium]|nr:phosphatidylglycerophosphatase A [Desulfovibrionaceae bacterium]
MTREEEKALPLGDRLVLDFCRVGVAGLARTAPGTWGSFLALLLAPWLFLPLPLWGRALLLAGIFVLGALAAGRAEQLLHKQDPGEVVIDELLGVWLVLLPFTQPTVWMGLAAFGLFRLFDIAKPWPVGASEHWLPAGWGIMLDDALAGVLACACLAVLVWLV